MKKKSSESSVQGKRAAKSAKHIPDLEIDFSDMPEATDEQLKNAKRVGRPKTGDAKELIAIRISPKLLERIRRLALKKHKAYQTLIHELLEEAVA